MPKDVSRGGWNAFLHSVQVLRGKVAVHYNMVKPWCSHSPWKVSATTYQIVKSAQSCRIESVQKENRFSDRQMALRSPTSRCGRPLLSRARWKRMDSVCRSLSACTQVLLHSCCHLDFILPPSLKPLLGWRPSLYGLRPLLGDSSSIWYTCTFPLPVSRFTRPQRCDPGG